jgi:CheY-like chemotaxis protein
LAGECPARATEALIVDQIRSGLSARPDLPQKIISALARDKASVKSAALFGYLFAATSGEAFGAEHYFAVYRVKRPEEIDVAIRAPDVGQVVDDAHEPPCAANRLKSCSLLYIFLERKSCSCVVSLLSLCSATRSDGVENVPVILVVEDEHLVQRVAEDCLTDAGFKTAMASTSENAVELFDGSDGKYRPLVTDINLGRGGIDGWDVARRHCKDGGLHLRNASQSNVIALSALNKPQPTKSRPDPHSEQKCGASDRQPACRVKRLWREPSPSRMLRRHSCNETRTGRQTYDHFQYQKNNAALATSNRANAGWIGLFHSLDSQYSTVASLNFQNLVLAAFASAVWNCSSAAEVAIVLNEADQPT